MKSMNNVRLVGWLANDPKVIKTKTGKAFATLRMATDVFIPQKGNEPKKITSWHTIKIWKPEIIKTFDNYLMKGSHILVDGSIVYRTYTDEQGRNWNVTEIIVNHLIDLDR